MIIEVSTYQAKLSKAYIWSSSEEEFLKEQQKYTTAGFEPKQYNKDDSCHYYIKDSREVIVCDKDRLAELIVAGIQFDKVIENKIKTNIADALAEYADKPIQLLTEQPGSQYNSKVDVHMPGQALAMYNDTLLLEDACTDELQRHINNGWRIIAACPQPDQRRPDYILGRYNPDMEV